MLSEVSQVVKDKYHMISPISGTLSTKQTSEQNRTGDLGIKNKVTVTRGKGGRGRGIMEERRRRSKPRNINRGLIGMDNVRGLTVGAGRDGARVRNGEKRWTAIKDTWTKPKGKVEAREGGGFGCGGGEW